GDADITAAIPVAAETADADGPDFPCSARAVAGDGESAVPAAAAGAEGLDAHAGCAVGDDVAGADDADVAAAIAVAAQAADPDAQRAGACAGPGDAPAAVTAAAANAFGEDAAGRFAEDLDVPAGADEHAVA